MKKTIAQIFSLLLAIAVFYFFGRAIYENWRQIRDYDLNFDITLLLLASFMYALSMAIFGIGWHVILRYVHYYLPLFPTLLYFFITQPAKYIPGKVWIGVTRMKLCKPHGVPNSVTFLTTGIEAVIEIFAATYVSLAFGLMGINSFGRYSLEWVIFLTALGLVLLIPRVFYFFINRYLRLVKQPLVPAEKWVSFPKLLLLQLLYITGIICFGFSHLIFLNAFAPVGNSHAAFIIGVSAFSYIAGILAFFSPGGLGVREGIFFVALQKIMPAHIALIFSLASRAWGIAVEALLLAFSLPIFWIIRRRDAHRDHRLPLPDVSKM